jgi:hypothetical protein
MGLETRIRDCSFLDLHNLHDSYDVVRYDARATLGAFQLERLWNVVDSQSGRLVCRKSSDGSTDPVVSDFLREHFLAYTIVQQTREVCVIEKRITCVHLVVYSPGEFYTPMYHLTREYYRRFPTVKTLYYAFSDTMQSEIEERDDLLWIRGKERYDPWHPTDTPGIFEKTMIALDWVRSRYPFAYVVRSNVSTLINFDLLLPRLAQQTFSYGGAIAMSMPPHGVFVRGICILLSKPLVDALLAHRHEMNPALADDIGLGELIHRCTPLAFPPSFTFPEHTSFVPDCGGDLERLRAHIRPQTDMCYRFKHMDTQGQFNLNEDARRIVDVQQLGQVVQILTEQLDQQAETLKPSTKK